MLRSTLVPISLFFHIYLNNECKMLTRLNLWKFPQWFHKKTKPFPYTRLSYNKKINDITKNVKRLIHRLTTLHDHSVYELHSEVHNSLVLLFYFPAKAIKEGRKQAIATRWKTFLNEIELKLLHFTLLPLFMDHEKCCKRYFYYFCYLLKIFISKIP